MLRALLSERSNVVPLCLNRIVLVWPSVSDRLVVSEWLPPAGSVWLACVIVVLKLCHPLTDA